MEKQELSIQEAFLLVLILLLMEYGHGDNQRSPARGHNYVLILLLMEYGHGD